jgi:hypothetical protein
MGGVEKIGDFIAKVKDKNSGVKLMGFGHRVYKNYDPRATLMRETCHEVLGALGLEADPGFRCRRTGRAPGSSCPVLSPLGVRCRAGSSISDGAPCAGYPEPAGYYRSGVGKLEDLIATARAASHLLPT